MTVEQSERHVPSPPRQYRWTCPICGRSRTRLVAAGDDERYVRNDLESHIRTTGGDGHGPNGSCPGRVTREALHEHVERFDL